MIIVGITGGIACGKSFVTALFAKWGAVRASADEDARTVIAPGSLLLEQVLAAFPEPRLPDGTLSRALLAQRTFADSIARAKLESLLHPAIFARMESTISAARSSDAAPLLAYEVPLLFEKHREAMFDKTLAVVCSPETQGARLQVRELTQNGATLTPEQIAARLATQLPNAEKARLADFVITTDGSEDGTTEQARIVWRGLVGSEPAKASV